MARLQLIDFPLRGDHIPLDALLKATGLAPSGGAAKVLVAEGNVQVDGQTELRRTCKLRAGQVVQVASTRIHLQAASDAPEPDAAAGPQNNAAPPTLP